MANRVTILKGSKKEDHGILAHRVLYIHSIDPPIEDGRGNVIVPQTQKQLPDDVIATGTKPYLSTDDLNALDAGRLGFEVLQYAQTAGETIEAFESRLGDDHTAREAWWVQFQRDIVANAGRAVA